MLKIVKKHIQIIEVTKSTGIIKLGIRNLPALIVEGKLCSQGTDIDEKVIEEVLAG